MALDSSYRQQVFVELFEKAEYPDGRPEPLELVTRREDVTNWPEAKRRELAVSMTSGLDRRMYGVRIARITVEVFETF
jgi:hypothetical protein